MTQTTPSSGLRLTWRWDIVWLGRLAGAFVIASALGLGIWSAVGFDTYYEGTPFRFRVYDFWRTFVGIGWSGVAIILLAELVDRVPRATRANTRPPGHRYRRRTRTMAAAKASEEVEA